MQVTQAKRTQGRRIEFTEEEQEYLIDNYKKISQVNLGRQLGCSPTGIRNFYIRVGLTKPNTWEDHPGVKKNSKRIECKCPRCTTRYIRKIELWQGHIPARIYCDSWQRIVDDLTRGNPFI